MSGKRVARILFSVLFISGLLYSAQAQAGRDMPPRYGERLCENPDYHCITIGYDVVDKKVRTRKGVVTKQIKRRQTWEKLWPDERERDIVMKVNRMNIRLRTGMIIAVPNDMKGKTFMDFSPFPSTLERQCDPTGPVRCYIKCVGCDEDGNASSYKRVCEQPCNPQEKLTCGEDGTALGERVIVVDLAMLAFAAYDEQGDLLRWGPVSGGRNWGRWVNRAHLTRVGNDFHIRYKYGRGARSSIYPLAKGDKPAGGAPVPYFMSFSKGYGLHHYYEVPGRHASHGCVRLFYDDAKWLNREFAQVGTRVIVLPYAEDDSSPILDDTADNYCLACRINGPQEGK